jgi:hypothetical protein
MSKPPGNLQTLKPYQPTWKTGKTRVIRVPIAIADELLTLARKLDEGKFVATQDDLNSVAKRVLKNRDVTRNTKDSGAVKRALVALNEGLALDSLNLSVMSSGDKSAEAQQVQ